ncbi:MAG TPA: flagellar basal-body MS-ring/collar protein FliF [Micropepsaceae bacterium]|nr:flagellar basal-body MS-ring/collar protein FliF [Micropepsaceae bacterium]
MPEFFRGIGAARIGAMAGVAAALTGFFLYVFGIIAEPPKSILFSGLEARDASAVISKLEALNVPYEQKGDGGTILIPSDQVTKIRMQLATDGLPSAGVGYEIFDKTDTFGTTAFVQNVNRLRAIEGELARTIRSLDSIASARVHLVIPDRQIFARDNQPPSASVVVKARSRLSRGQVSAIQHLVAAAVAGLTPNNVALVDDKGELLAGGNGDGDNATSAVQEERISGFEDRLRQRVENIVSSIVGPGHSRVQVAAEMDFNRVTETAETFDPDSRVVRSSQTVQQDSASKDNRNAQAVSVGLAIPGQAVPPAPTADNSSTSNNTRNEETINYEISKTTKTQTLDAGQVKKLSVAVVVDGTYTPGANGARAYAPRSGDDMTKITALVRSAIGFDEKRGDQLQVTNMRFADIDTGPEAPPAVTMLGLDTSSMFKLGQILILSITALLVFLLVVKPMIRRLTTPLAPMAGGTAALSASGAPQLTQGSGDAHGQQHAGGSPSQLAAPKRESMIDISQIDGQVRESAIRKVGDVVQAHPEEAMAILRTWLHQPV